MKKLLMPLLATAALAFAPVAWSQHSQKQIEEDIKRHLAMAEAHQAAAQCLQ